MNSRVLCQTLIRYPWSRDEQAQLLGAYFWGFMMTQIPGGMFCEIYGARSVVAYSLALCGLITLLLPLKPNLSVWEAYFVRWLTGVFSVSSASVWFSSLRNTYLPLPLGLRISWRPIRHFTMGTTRWKKQVHIRGYWWSGIRSGGHLADDGIHHANFGMAMGVLHCGAANYFRDNCLVLLRVQ